MSWATAIWAQRSQWGSKTKSERINNARTHTRARESSVDLSQNNKMSFAVVSHHRTHFWPNVILCCCVPLRASARVSFMPCSTHFDLQHEHSFEIQFCYSRSRSDAVVGPKVDGGVYLKRQTKWKTIWKKRKRHTQKHFAHVFGVHARIRCGRRRTHALSCQQSTRKKKKERETITKKWPCLWALITCFNFSGCHLLLAATHAAIRAQSCHCHIKWIWSEVWGLRATLQPVSA